MPIINNLSGNEIEILKLADFLTVVEHDITDVYFGELQIFTVWAETEGALPLTINANGEALIDYKIYGNLSQNGTPIPSDPIYPSECGERTANLFDLNRLPSNTWTTDTRYYLNGGIATSKSVNPAIVTVSVNNGTLSVTTNGGNGAGFLVEVKPSTKYRLVFAKSESLDSSKTSCTYALVDTSETIGYLRAIYGDDDGANFTTDSNTKYVYFVFRKASGTISYSNIMLVEGSTAPTSYIPYGYKLPLTSGNTSVNIYLGESQTTRQIKKLVLTGEENWSITSNNRLRIGLSGQLRPFAPICSHYTGSAATAWGNLLDKSITVSIAGYLAIYDTTYDNTTDFKAYLAQQYANGTPVTVWYVLATPATGTLNEPLRKIGDYIDSVSGTGLPTLNGTTVYDADLATKPSKMYVKYRKNGT